MAKDNAISLQAVTFQWPGPGGFGLDIPEFAVGKGEAVLLLGDSGSGKSTLLSLICGTLVASSGLISVNGTRLSGLTGSARDRFRVEQIGLVFQQFNLLPFGTVRDNILLPLRFAPERRSRCTPQPDAHMARLCRQLGLPEGLEKRKAAELSVGQQQRVAVARALIGAPPILIADEPTSALDETHQAQFLDLMFAQLRAQDSTLLMVSHDPRLADRFDRTVNMSDIATLRRSAA